MRLADVLVCLACLSCQKAADPTAAPPRRATLKPLTATSFELIPEPGQAPYCLAYTVSAKGVIRLLTMSADNLSFECPAGEPIGHHPYRVPETEPTVKVLVLFTSQQISSTTVSAQLLDANRAASLTAMDLRLPGQAALELLDFAAAPASVQAP